MRAGTRESTCASPYSPSGTGATVPFGETGKRSLAGKNVGLSRLC